MIPSHELRKNNLVLRDGQIVEVGWHSLGFDMVPDEPIRLSPEILIKFGAEKTYATNCYKIKFEEFSEHSFYITLTESDANILSIGDNYTGKETLIVLTGRVINYLHQLQNIFFDFTGKELKKKSYIDEYKCN